MRSLVDTIKIGVLFTLIFMMIFSYHPLIVQSISDEAADSPFMPYIMGMFLILLMLSFNIPSIIKSKTIIISSVFILLFILTLLTIFTLGYDVDILTGRALLIALGAMIIGWQLNISDKTLKIVLIFFGLLTIFVTLSQIILNIGEFVIQNESLVHAKNALGCVVGAAITVFYIAALNSKNSVAVRIATIIAVLTLLICLLTMRARTATLVAFILIIFLSFKASHKKTRSPFIAIFITIGSLVAIYFLLPDIAKGYIYDSFVQNHENDITSDRINRNEQALHFLNDNMWFGNIDGKAQVGWIHNYPLLQAYNYGLVGGLSVLCLYFYLLFVVVKSLIKKSVFNIRNIGFVMITVSFGISMAEPTFPFGPGTVNVLNFILFGVALRYNYEQKYGYI